MDAEEQLAYAQYRCDGGSPENASSVSLCARFGVEVAHVGEPRGKIVRATRDIACGEVAWVEDPLVGMAHLSHWRLVADSCCARCLRPLGSLQQAWERTGAALREEARAARRKRMKKMQGKGKGKGKKGKTSGEEEEATQAQEEEEEADLPMPDALPFLSQAPAGAASLDSSSATTHTLHVPSCDPVPCAGGCGGSYCSTQCRDWAFSHSHELLCSGGSGGGACTAAHAALLKHASAQNEIFLLAAQAVAHMTLQALRNMQRLPQIRQLLGLAEADSTPSAMLPFALQLHSHLSSLPSADAAQLRAQLESCAAAACLPFQRFCGAVWWEHVALPESMCGDEADPDEEAEYRQGLCGVAEQSLTKLVALAQAKLESSGASSSSAAVAWEDVVSSLCLEDAWSLSTFGRVLSSFERNNIGFHAPTTLGLYVAHVRSLPAEERSQAMQQLGAHLWDAMQRRADGSAPPPAAAAAASSAPLAPAPPAVPPCGVVEGTGLFVLGCCMNHSCDPNVTLRPKCAPADESATEVNDAALRVRMHQLVSRGERAAGDSGASDTPAAATASTPAPLPLPLPAALLDRSAIFVALRDISAGEELNISYIDLLHQPAADEDEEEAGAPAREVGFAERQKQLRAYDFVCQCAKCVREAGSSAATAP